MKREAAVGLGRKSDDRTTLARMDDTAQRGRVRETAAGGDLPGIAAKGVSGYGGIQLLRRTIGASEVEFVTIMWFDSWDAVRQFAGEDYEHAYVPAKARAVLSRFDDRSQHYEIRARLAY